MDAGGAETGAAAGGNEPHPNTPPYRVLNFRHKVGK